MTTDTIEILDSMHGTGKSTSLLNIIRTDKENKYIYVKSSLDTSLTDFDMSFYETDNKMNSLLDSLLSGNNIHCTINFLLLTDSNHHNIIREQKYILIFDECNYLIMKPQFKLTKNDIMYLKDNKSIKIHDNKLGLVEWMADPKYYDFRYDDVKNFAKVDSLFSSTCHTCFVIHFPIDLIKSCKRVILSTYRFKNSINEIYCKLKGLEISYLDNTILANFDKSTIKPLIEILNFTYYKQFNHRNILSTTWYENSDAIKFNLISKIIRNVCLSKLAKKEDVMWTVPKIHCIDTKSNQNRINPKGYSAIIDGDRKGCFVACSTTNFNKHQNKWMLVHAYNRYPNQFILIYVRGYGFNINADEFALSEAIQWVWRSRIRKNEHIKLCFIPKRMKTLFTEWLNDD